MRPSSIHRPSAQGGSNSRRGRSGASLASRARAAGSDRGRQGAESREASWGNISENKGIGTSVSMVIPSSGGSWDAGRENALRACSRTAPHRAAPRRDAPRRVAPQRAGTRRGSRNPSPSHPAEEMPEQTRWKKRDEMGDKLDFLQGMGRDAARR